jgi:hypothetical protein
MLRTSRGVINAPPSQFAAGVKARRPDQVLLELPRVLSKVMPEAGKIAVRSRAKHLGEAGREEGHLLEVSIEGLPLSDLMSWSA